MGKSNIWFLFVLRQLTGIQQILSTYYEQTSVLDAVTYQAKSDTELMDENSMSNGGRT